MSGTLSAARQRAMHYATRDQSFSKLTSAHLEKLKNILSIPSATSRTGKLLVTPEDCARFNADWTHQVEGACPAVLLPSDTSHVQEIVKYCQAEKLALVPQGGNTGLVYGGAPAHDELVLSLALLNAPPVVEADTMTVEAEAGVILQTCQECCEKEGFLFPLSMGSKGSAMIGGCVSTNAGGIHYARYGSMHANVLGLEVVTATGEVLDLRSTLRKDNAGYDLKHLFIGSEGTLGVVTRAVVKLAPLPKSRQVTLFRLPNFESVLQLYQLAQEHLAECLSAFEVMDGECLTPTAQEQIPFAKISNNGSFQSGDNYHSAYFVILIETNGSVEEHDFAKLSQFIEHAEEKFGTAITTPGQEPILSQSGEQREQLWSLRENTPIHLAKDGLIYKFDVSFPLHQFYNIVEYTRELLYRTHHFHPEEVYVMGYGHFGDGNVHLNVVDRTRKISKRVGRGALSGGVCVLCESCGKYLCRAGVGLQKRDYLPCHVHPP
ncbi:actin interacting protein-like protein [Angomonas deanei]|nr:actin interacting protein-like protein [Angomonas deanei]|eukprot:EPY41543.1 actin interacting protein-like protein [Angomonas deanei]